MANDELKTTRPRLLKSPVFTGPSIASSSPLRSAMRPKGRFYQYRGAVLLLLLVLVVWMNVTFLIPLTMGAIFAVILFPLMRRLAKWRVGSMWKAGLVTLAFAISFMLPLGAILFFGAQEALGKIQEFQASGFDASKISVPSVLNYLGLKSTITWVADVTPVTELQIQELATRAMTTAGALAAKLMQDLLASLPGAMFSTFIILIAVFFLLVDGKRAVHFIHENSFFGPLETESIFDTVASLCYSVVVSSIAAGAVQSALIVVSCLLTGTHGAILIALVAFMLSFIPVVGTSPVTLSLMIHALIVHDSRAAVIFGIFVVLVPLCENFVRPLVLKGGGRLHPLVGFVAAFGALDTIGFYGVFIGPVVAGLFFTLLPMVTRSYKTLR